MQALINDYADAVDDFLTHGSAQVEGLQSQLGLVSRLAWMLLFELDADQEVSFNCRRFYCVDFER